MKNDGEAGLGGGKRWRSPQGTVFQQISTRDREVQKGRSGGQRKGRERERKRDDKGREEVGRDGGGILVLQIHAGE